jgi:hypothetical protein
MKRLKRLAVVGATAMAIGASVLTAGAPAYASSGMTCSTSKSGNGYWFYCSGYQNLYGAWMQVECFNFWTQSFSYPTITHNYTEYAPYSFGEYIGCGSSWLSSAQNPNWGPR